MCLDVCRWSLDGARLGTRFNGSFGRFTLARHQGVLLDQTTGHEIVTDSVRRLLDRGVRAQPIDLLQGWIAQSVVAEEAEGGESEQAESGVSVFSASSAALSSTSRDRRVCAAAEPEGDYESVVTELP